jgi:hypothetical protein
MRMCTRRVVLRVILDYGVCCILASVPSALVFGSTVASYSWTFAAEAASCATLS